MVSTQLIQAMFPVGHSSGRLEKHIPFINPALEWGKINTPMDTCAFFAQDAAESSEYQFLQELASGDEYDTRTDLGNTPEVDGDGAFFKGEGPIQITGRNALRDCGLALGIDLVQNPTLLQLPQYATMSAVWFWTKYKFGLQAASRVGWFRLTTRIVNGGYNGWDARLAYYQRNLRLMGLAPYSMANEDGSIRMFQSAHGLAADGQAGAKTLTALVKAGA